MTARAALALLATAFIGTCAIILTEKGEVKDALTFTAFLLPAAGSMVNETRKTEQEKEK